jgi:Protein of unknown function, DUF/Integrase core domain
MPDNGQIERMNRTIKDATVKRDHYDTHEQLRAHLQLFVDAYNHARRLKTLRGLTPYEFICQTWTKETERFRLDPSHHMAGPYSYVVEEHVLAGAIKRLLAEKPEDAGPAVPGMPVGSPGMEVAGMEPDTYDVVLFGPEGRRTFASYRGGEVA